MSGENRFQEQLYAAMVQGTIIDGQKKVTTAATAVQIAALGTNCRTVVITALSGNTGTVVIGGSTVVAAASTRRGIPLAANQSVTIGIDDLGKLWLDSTVNGEGVCYAYLV